MQRLDEAVTELGDRIKAANDLGDKEASFRLYMACVQPLIAELDGTG